MSRNTILVFGAICWTGAAVDALYHALSGDMVVPAAMGLTFAIWVTVSRRYHRRVAVRA